MPFIRSLAASNAAIVFWAKSLELLLFSMSDCSGLELPVDTDTSAISSLLLFWDLDLFLDLWMNAAAIIKPIETTAALISKRR